MTPFGEVYVKVESNPWTGRPELVLHMSDNQMPHVVVVTPDGRDWPLLATEGYDRDKVK